MTVPICSEGGCTECEDIPMKASVGSYQIKPPPREKVLWVTTVLTSHADSWQSRTGVLHNVSFSFPHTLDGISQSGVTIRNHVCGEDMEQLTGRGAMASQVHQETTQTHGIV